MSVILFDAMLLVLVAGAVMATVGLLLVDTKATVVILLAGRLMLLPALYAPRVLLHTLLTGTVCTMLPRVEAPVGRLIVAFWLDVPLLIITTV